MSNLGERKKQRQVHFDTEINMPQELLQLYSISISDWSHSEKNSINIIDKNKKQHYVQQWTMNGTPLVTSIVLLALLWTTTFRRWLDRKSEIHPSTGSVRSMEWILVKRWQWLTITKAFLKPKKTTSIT